MVDLCVMDAQVDWISMHIEHGKHAHGKHALDGLVPAGCVRSGQSGVLCWAVRSRRRETQHISVWPNHWSAACVTKSMSQLVILESPGC